jgi:hypothetical protein
VSLQLLLRAAHELHNLCNPLLLVLQQLDPPFVYWPPSQLPSQLVLNLDQALLKSRSVPVHYSHEFDTGSCLGNRQALAAYLPLDVEDDPWPPDQAADKSQRRLPASVEPLGVRALIDHVLPKLVAELQLAVSRDLPLCRMEGVPHRRDEDDIFHGPGPDHVVEKLEVRLGRARHLVVCDFVQEKNTPERDSGVVLGCQVICDFGEDGGGRPVRVVESWSVDDGDAATLFLVEIDLNGLTGLSLYNVALV